MLFISSSAPDKLNAMYEAFCDINNLDVDVLFRFHENRGYYNDKRTFFEKIMTKLKLPVDKENHNKRIIEYCTEHKPDYIFIVKGNHVKPFTLKKIKNSNVKSKIISWTQDDMFAFHNRSLYYTYGLKYYDLVVTQKSYNCDKNELPSLGAKNILFQNKAYLPRIHKPYNKCLNNGFKHNILFIGFAEKERFESMNYLAKNGFTVVIYGSGWDKEYYKNTAHENLVFNFKNLLNEDYAQAISCSKITLCFLRKQNRDLQTSRTVEIPACGGFMLAERTNEQLEMFSEKKEAEYFSTNQELLNKVRYYLENKKERKVIANHGRIKCLSSDYSYQDKAVEILKKVNEL